MKKVRLLVQRYKITVLVSSIAFFAFCCGTKSLSSSVTLAPTQADVTIADAHWQGTTLDQLNKGYSIYSDKCTQCHGMKKPQDFTEDDWTINYLPDMGKRARLAKDEYDLVLHYILSKREEIVSAKK